ELAERAVEIEMDAGLVARIAYPGDAAGKIAGIIDELFARQADVALDALEGGVRQERGLLEDHAVELAGVLAVDRSEDRDRLLRYLAAIFTRHHFGDGAARGDRHAVQYRLRDAIADGGVQRLAVALHGVDGWRKLAE